MPYISPERKREITLDGDPPENVGELTYVFYRDALRYLKDGDLSYARLAEVTAALENAKLEFYRRQITPYEDKKIDENGDVT